MTLQEKMIESGLKNWKEVAKEYAKKELGDLFNGRGFAACFYAAERSLPGDSQTDEKITQHIAGRIDAWIEKNKGTGADEPVSTTPDPEQEVVTLTLGGTSCPVKVKVQKASINTRIPELVEAEKTGRSGPDEVVIPARKLAKHLKNIISSEDQGRAQIAQVFIDLWLEESNGKMSRGRAFYLAREIKSFGGEIPQDLVDFLEPKKEVSQPSSEKITPSPARSGGENKKPPTNVATELGDSSQGGDPKVESTETSEAVSEEASETKTGDDTSKKGKQMKEETPKPQPEIGEIYSHNVTALAEEIFEDFLKRERQKLKSQAALVAGAEEREKVLKEIDRQLEELARNRSLAAAAFKAAADRLGVGETHAPTTPEPSGAEAEVVFVADTPVTTATEAKTEVGSSEPAPDATNPPAPSTEPTSSSDSAEVPTLPAPVVPDPPAPTVAESEPVVRRAQRPAGWFWWVPKIKMTRNLGCLTAILVLLILVWAGWYFWPQGSGEVQKQGQLQSQPEQTSPTPAPSPAVMPAIGNRQLTPLEAVVITRGTEAADISAIALVFQTLGSWTEPKVSCLQKQARDWLAENPQSFDQDTILCLAKELCWSEGIKKVEKNGDVVPGDTPKHRAVSYSQLTDLGRVPSFSK